MLSFADVPRTTEFCHLDSSETGPTFCNLWTTAGGDFLWRLRSSGGTPSSSTGPSSLPPNGASYLFIEASSPNYSRKTSYLTSTDAWWSGVSFEYHMYGSNTGSLTVQTQGANGLWTDAWSLSGAQQASGADAWREADVLFSASCRAVRFVSVTGTGYRGDTAIANIVLRHGEPYVGTLCPPLPAPPPKRKNKKNWQKDGTCCAPPMCQTWGSGTT